LIHASTEKLLFILGGPVNESDITSRFNVPKRDTIHLCKPSAFITLDRWIGDREQLGIRDGGSACFYTDSRKALLHDDEEFVSSSASSYPWYRDYTQSLSHQLGFQKHVFEDSYRDRVLRLPFTLSLAKSNEIPVDYIPGTIYSVCIELSNSKYYNSLQSINIPFLKASESGGQGSCQGLDGHVPIGKDSERITTKDSFPYFYKVVLDVEPFFPVPTTLDVHVTYFDDTGTAYHGDLLPISILFQDLFLPLPSLPSPTQCTQEDGGDQITESLCVFSKLWDRILSPQYVAALNEKTHFLFNNADAGLLH
jgi:hypothetical protein